MPRVYDGGSSIAMPSNVEIKVRITLQIFEPDLQDLHKVSDAGLRVHGWRCAVRLCTSAKSARRSSAARKPDSQRLRRISFENLKSPASSSSQSMRARHRRFPKAHAAQ
jgi:hypothetical protein